MRVHKRRRIPRQKYTLIFRAFVSNISALKTSLIVGVNRKTADCYFNIFRKVILLDALREKQSVKFGNGIKADESYFGPKRVGGKRSKEAGKKIIIFGLLKRQGKIYARIIKNTQKQEVMPIQSQTNTDKRLAKTT